ncbi:MAG: AAA family ATPase [Lachnospiraceae bacterium]|nr:AAA family ATPase [Lachnospiraceae bacterium]
MRAYSNEKLHEIAGENYRILCGYCSMLEEEGYWEHPKAILKHPILDFLSMYIQALMIHLAVYRKVEDEQTLHMIAATCGGNPLAVNEVGLSEGNIKEAERLVMAPPILLQLCSLRDVERHSSLTGLFFDAVLNILFAESYLNQQSDPAVTRYVKEYYGRIHVFIESANTHGACVDEKYLFRKICMGDLESNTEQLKEAGEDFKVYKQEALFLTERRPAPVAQEKPEEEIVEPEATEPEFVSVEEQVSTSEEPEPAEVAEVSHWDELPMEEDAEGKDTEETGQTEDVIEEDASERSEEEAEAEAPQEAKTEEEQIEIDFLAARLTKPLKELNDLVGLKEVKEEIHSLINLIRVRKMREKYQLPSLPMSYHMVFTGNPGTGKTTVARLVGRIYRELGILSHGTMIETDRAGLVAGYVGQTALKVKEVVEKAKGGILFIDEAYTLSNKLNDNDFGSEAIDTLVKMMEDYREDLVIIVAGYTKEMEQFLQANTGLQSRFNKFICFQDYSQEELLEIMHNMAEKAGFCVEQEAVEYIAAYLEAMSEEEKARFGNARGIRNLFEKLVTAQANRVICYQAPTKEQLSAITREDCMSVIQMP